MLITGKLPRPQPLSEAVPLNLLIGPGRALTSTPASHSENLVSKTEIANGRGIFTKRFGCSFKGVLPGDGFEPIRKLPAGTITIIGQCIQSLNKVPTGVCPEINFPS